MSAVDPVKLERFRERLREEWTDKQTVAAWRKWHAQIAAFTRAATEALLEAARLRPGMRVLDLASGVGDPALSIAQAVGPSGHVIATDLGPGMIGLAEELAKARGLANIEFRVADAEALPFPEQSFDVVTCRFGVMFFPDQVKAFQECRRVLKPGGRVAFVVWGKREQLFQAVTGDILMKYVEAPPPDPQAPDAFMFGERGLLERRIKAATFSDVREEVRTVTGLWTGSLEEFWQQFSELAPQRRKAIAKLAPETVANLEAEILAGLRKLLVGKVLTVPLEIVIGTGAKA
jgi:ubiquinone/menaquinone biosynthesis C-methylase UbiE